MRAKPAIGLISCLVALVASLGGMAAVSAQTSTRPLPITGVDVTKYPQVAAVVTVPAEVAGSGLAPGAVAVTENGVPRPVTAVPLGGLARQVILAIDTSGSMAGTPIIAAKAAAIDFASRMPASVPIGVIGFSMSPVIASPATLDRKATTVAIQRLRAVGETALYDAVNQAADSFPPGGEEKDIVVLSDGGDTVSHTQLPAVTQKLSVNHIHLDAVELVTPDTDAPVLAKLASAGGGQVAPAQNPAALNGVFQEIATGLIDQYRLTFSSAARGSAGLHVTVTGGGIAAEGEVTLQLPAAPPAPAAPPPPPPRHVLVHSAHARSLMASTGALAVGAVAIFIALVVTFSLALVPRRRAKLARLGKPSRRTDSRSTLTELANRATAAADQTLAHHGKQSSLNDALERAGLAWRPGEFLVLALCAVFVATVAGTVIASIWLGVLLAAVTGFGCRVVIGILGSRRQARFSDQLGDTLQLLSGSLRAGYGLLQAVDAVAREAERPTKDEFRRVVVETRLGRSLSESLHASASRMKGEDYDWVVQAIDIHREVGGDLAEVLDNVSGTIRERNQLRRQVKALTAEGRISAYILLAMPFFLAFMLHLINPGYFAQLLSGVGLVMLIGGLVLMVLGAIWLRKLCRLQF